MVDIVPKVSVISFGNDTIKRKRHDKTIKRRMLAKGPGDTRYNTSIILHTRCHVFIEFTEW